MGHYLCQTICVCVCVCVYKITKNSTKNLLDLISKFKVSRYKINIQKLVAFLYTKNELSEREIKKTISFTIVPKGINYLEINLTKEVKDACTENSKRLKEIEEDTEMERYSMS